MDIERIAFVNDTHRHMAVCAAEAARIAAGIRPDQLDNKTPCTEYDVRTLADHWVLYSAHGLECRAQRRPIPEELTTRAFSSEPGWAAGYAAQVERAVTAWADPAAWTGDVDLGGGHLMPAAEIAGLVIKELAVHGWDLAQATGQEIRVPEPEGAFLLDVVAAHAEVFRQYDGFADPVVPDPSATSFERALALSGRDPHWTP